VDPIKSQLELFTSRTTIEAAIDEANLQMTELKPHGSLAWLSDIDASEQQTVDTLRLYFQPSGVTARIGRDSGSAGYGEKVKAGNVSLVVSSKPPADSASFLVVPRETVAETIAGGLKANRRVDTDIADLSFVGGDPYFSQRVLNAMTYALQTLSIRQSKTTAQARRQFLDQQLRKTDSALEVKRSQLSDFRSRTQTFSSKDKIAAEQTNMASLRVRREELRADRDVYTSLLARALAARRSGSVDGLRALLSAPGIESNRAVLDAYQQVVQTKSALDSLTQGPFPAAPTNPDVVRLNSMLQSAADQLVAAVSSQIEGFNARIAALDAMGARGAADASLLPQSEAEEARLLQEEAGTQRIAEQLREEQQRAAISEVAQGGSVQIVDIARKPGDPITPARTRTILLATVLALFLAIELALLLDGLTKSFRKSSEVEELLNLPTLGSVPNLDAVSGKNSLRLPKRRPALPAPGKSGNLPVAPSLVAYTAPAYESFRALRTSLMFSHAAKKLRSIIVTSAAPGDGKSTTAANLAGAFAQQGLRVIAIDCDIKVGRLHKLFGLPGGPGLMEVILGEASLEEAIHETSIPNLWMLAAGKKPPNSTELLGSEAVRQILQRLNSEFDFLIIDTPPVLATADAAVLGSLVDGVVLVVRVGVTERAATKLAVDRMRATGARMVGTVLNDPDQILGSREGYYHYQYGYGEKAGL
jgi:capsular exopolysaccharide synthesis family protein